MSSDAMRTVLDQMLDDDGFRQQMMEDPDSALAGYDLSEAERHSLLNGDAGSMEQHLGQLDERVSKSGIFPLGSKGGVGIDRPPGIGGGSC